jgi:hypothetical protein
MELDLLTTCIHHSELHFTDHWHTQTSVLRLLQSSIAVSWQRFLQGRFFNFSRSVPLVTTARAELLSTDNSTNWVPDWRPFHTSPLVFLHKITFNCTDLQLNSLTHQPATSRHFIKLNWIINQSVSLSWCRAPSGAHDPILLPDWHLLSCPCGAPILTRERFCHLSESQSAVISLLSVFTIYILHVIKCMYIQHIQGLCQFMLSTADHALSSVAPAATAVWSLERSYAWPPLCTDRLGNTVSNKACLPIRCLQAGCVTPFFYCCVRICFVRYLATTTVYRVTA